MPLNLTSVIPPLAPLLLLVEDVLYGGYRNRRREKEVFALHLKRVITLLESASTSASESDSQWILNFQTRLVGILEDLDPRHRSIVCRIRARWMCDERFMDQINREIDTVLRLVELKTVVSLSGGVVSIRGGIEHLLSISDNSTTYNALDRRFDSSTSFAHNGVCRCAARRDIPKHSNIVHGGSELDTTVQWEPQAFDQLLDAAEQNVIHHRRLAQQDHNHRPCLASSLDLLVQLLRQAGRISDALQYSLEANRLLGMMTQEAS